MEAFEGTLEFQSTCLREARPRCRLAPDEGRNFNPRAYVRHDGEVACVEVGCRISIHVPT